MQVLLCSILAKVSLSSISSGPEVELHRRSGSGVIEQATRTGSVYPIRTYQGISVSGNIHHWGGPTLICKSRDRPPTRRAVNIDTNDRDCLAL